MNWFLPVLIGVASALALYCLVCLCIAWGMVEMIVKPRGPRRRSFEQVRREQHELDGFDYSVYDREPREEFLLPGGDPAGGVTIAGEFIPARNPPPGRPKCLIRVHGFTQNRLISVRFLGMFQEMGYSAVIYDQRCFGNSSGKLCSFGLFERDDLSAIITWVKKRLGEDTFIAVHGESMGAMTCLLALEKDPRIDCVVADCGGSDFYAGAGEQLKNLYHLPRFPTLPFAELLIRRYGYSFKQVNPAAVVAKTGKPILFVHGTADLDVPSYMCGELYAQAKNPLSRMELFEGAGHGHSYSKDTPRYTKMTQEFVRAVEQSQGIIYGG